MPKTVSNRECREMMRNILDRLGDRLYIDKDDDEQYLESLQPEGKILPVLLYLEAKGCLKLGIGSGSHKLFRISITNMGRTYFEDIYVETHRKRVEWARYIITTLIAVAALIKSFMPEILELLETLLPGA